MMAGSAKADLVYDTDFTGEEYTQNSGAVVFDDGTTTSIEEWFGSTNGIGIAAGDLTLANNAEPRFRSTGVWLDTTGWAIGTVTVEIDVVNFTAGADSNFFFQAYAATGVDASNTVSLDLHGGTVAGLGQTGTATIGALGGQQAITAVGTAVPFTFNFNGTDDFVALTFAQVNANNGTEFGSVDLDNLTVNTVPEPSSLTLLAAGLGLVGLRRRRLK